MVITCLMFYKKNLLIMKKILYSYKSQKIIFTKAAAEEEEEGFGESWRLTNFSDHLISKKVVQGWVQV